MMTFVQGRYRTISIMAVLMLLFLATQGAWAQGNGTPFVNTRSIAREATGTYVLVDQASSRRTVVRIDPTTGDRRTLSSNFGGSGTGVLFAEPAQVAIMGPNPTSTALGALIPNGTLLVTDLQLDAIIKVHPGVGNREVISGCTVTPDPCPAEALIGMGELFEDIDGIAVAPDGTIVVADKTTASLIKVDQVTGDRTVFSSALVGTGLPFLEPKYLVSDGGSGWYVTDAGRKAVVHVDALGNRLLKSYATIGIGPVFESPQGIAITPDGSTLYVVDTPRSTLVQVNPLTGDRVDISSIAIGSPPNFLSPAAVTTDAVGSPIVVDPGYQAVFSVDAATGARTVLSRAATLTIAPSSGMLLQGQLFEMVLLAIGPGNTAVNLVATLDGVDVTQSLAQCQESTLPGGGVALSCPNAGVLLNLTPGRHILAVSLKLIDNVTFIEGPTVANQVVWDVLVTE